MDLTKDQLEELCRDVCPLCKISTPLRRRDDTGEYVHDFSKGTGFSHAFCLATHLRSKYQDVLDG